MTVLIGIAVKGHAVGGIINQPFFNYESEDEKLRANMGRTIWGVCGTGTLLFIISQKYNMS